MGERENRRVRGRHARGEGALCLLLAPFFFVPTTSKRLSSRVGRKFCVSIEISRTNEAYVI